MGIKDMYWLEMPVIKFTVERDPKVLRKREWGKMLRLVWYRMGRFWHRNLLKKHFTYAGAREYKYANRQGQGWKDVAAGSGWSTTYHARKIKRKHHGRPLEYSGELKKAALSLADVRATTKAATVVLRGLPAQVWRRPNENYPKMAIELTTISEEDLKILTKVGDKEIQKQLRKLASGTSSLALN